MIVTTDALRKFSVGRLCILREITSWYKFNSDKWGRCGSLVLMTCHWLMTSATLQTFQLFYAWINHHTPREGSTKGGRPTNVPRHARIRTENYLPFTPPLSTPGAVLSTRVSLQRRGTNWARVVFSTRAGAKVWWVDDQTINDTSCRCRGVQRDLIGHV